MKDLSYQEFVLHIQELVNKQLGMEYEIRLKTVQKNNGIERVGIVIGKKEEKVQPTIYLESYYEDYQKGTPITEIVMSILSSYDQFKEEAPEWKGQLSDMVDKVIFRIAGYEKNETLIQECPHIRYLDDLVLLFYIVAKEDEHGIGTIRITNQVLEQLDIDFEQLKKIAFANTRRMFPAVLQKMEDVIFQLVGDGDVSLDSKELNDSICDIEAGRKES